MGQLSYKGQPRVPGSGRVKGTKNKSTIRAEMICERMKLDPIEYLCYWVFGDYKALGLEEFSEYIDKDNKSPDNDVLVVQHTITTAMRLDALKTLTPYVRPKLAALAVQIDDKTSKELPKGAYDKYIIELHNEKLEEQRKELALESVPKAQLVKPEATNK